MKTLLVVFSALFLVIFSMSAYVNYNLNKATQNKIRSNEQILLNAERTILSARLGKITGDLIFIRASLLLNEESELGYGEIAQEWIAFSNSRQIYDQIRYLDIDGNEVIRVNYSKDGAVLVAPENLQNKKDRYYFTDTISLGENQIYISKLDLNIENNQLEQPIKPVLRISMPYYNGAHQLSGIIILNYLAEDMFGQVRSVSSASSGSMFMVNSEGYWMYNSSNPEKEWSFMYDGQKDVSFSAEFPREWEAIQSGVDGYLADADGVFLYSKILTSKEFSQIHKEYEYVLGSGDWTLITYLPSSSQNGKVFTQNLWQFLTGILAENYPYYLLLLPVSFIIAVLFALNESKKRQVKYFSEFDAMTGVYNRRAGLEKIEKMLTSAKGDCVNSICFIDINGLKEVNDTLGHDAGDALIKSVVEGIQRSTRAGDFIARLGGDEFLIIFEGIGVDQAEEIWSRIRQYFEQINETEHLRYLVSVSHGIESFDCGMQRQIDRVINIADEKMYREKVQMKKTLQVIRPAPSV
ncbi:MAG: sensor domain-containing diguanylate cyclase [Clostridiaceae bacterium]